ncbi:hypothetical protein M404DRAFT_35030 [Pisolithus tinctorius Marx 270]|uniref:Uncharacterized protein n=1 Tax=Pisolithus tinctorius Marx 270 TaxID=870435 RepID=A0A0C3NFC5_PISTI|nr:hypothetical protein M404DRAFT_35030 [Pisolithus tinctorius Marx 270]
MHRYRQVPTFGRDTICKFSNNASVMKKLAARDFEDLLQCSIPVFEGLLPPPYNNTIMDLLFELATWHTLAKLQLHTETSLHFLDSSTTRLGCLFCRFKTAVCDQIAMKDLPSEEAACGRCTAASAARAQGDGNSRPAAAQTGPQQRTFNLSTYKLHALGDYVTSIQLFGTTDNYSTQVGELEHWCVKWFYTRTNKIKFVHGIAKQQQRERLLHKLSNHRNARDLHVHTADASTSNPHPALSFSEQDPLPYSRPKEQYHISPSTKYLLHISSWLGQNADDLATWKFLPKLKDHILARIFGKEYDGDEEAFTRDQQNALHFDSLNPHMHADIMVLAHEDECLDQDGLAPHPYCPQCIDFLWVHWYAHDAQHKSGWNTKCLHRIGFFNANDDPDNAFGFLDPCQVIRGVHLIPAFMYGRTRELLPFSIARPVLEKDEDWFWYYVNIFCDHDMMMQFRSGGIGHKSTRSATDTFLDDLDTLDRQDDLGMTETVADDDQEGGNEHTVPDDDEEALSDPDEEDDFSYGSLAEWLDDEANEVDNVDDCEPV